jgi:nucleoside-diphosphate-sugar epimerase
LEKVLVTGGAGFIGSHVVERLVRDGAAAIVLDDLSTGHRENLEPFGDKARLVVGDIRDTDAVRQAMAGVRRVIHLAAKVSVRESVEEPALTYGVNVAGSLNVLEEARREGVECCAIASSAAVYGETGDQAQTEESPTRPASPYGLSKLACELLGRLYSETLGLPTVSLRLFNVYGPRQRPDSPYAAVIPAFVHRMSRGEPPVVYGDGTQRRDFIYVGDVANALAAAANRPDLAGQTFNIASGATVDLLELIELIRGILDTDVRPVFEAQRAGDIRYSAADVSRARRALLLDSLTPLAEGLARVVRHIKLGQTVST